MTPDDATRPRPARPAAPTTPPVPAPDRPDAAAAGTGATPDAPAPPAAPAEPGDGSLAAAGARRAGGERPAGAARGTRTARSQPSRSTTPSAPPPTPLRAAGGRPGAEPRDLREAEAREPAGGQVRARSAEHAAGEHGASREQTVPAPSRVGGRRGAGPHVPGSGGGPGRDVEHASVRGLLRGGGRAHRRGPGDVARRARRDPHGPGWGHGAWGLVAADVVGVAAGIAAGAAAGSPGPGVAGTAALLAVLLPAHRAGGLYRPGFAASALSEAPAVAVRAGAAWAVAAATAAALAPGSALRPLALLAALAATVLTACLLRAFHYARGRRAARRDPRSTLIVGAGPHAGPYVQQIAAALHGHPEYGLRPVGVVTPDPGAEPHDPAVRLLAAALHAQTPGAPPGLPLPVLTGHAEITRAVIQNSVRHAVVTGPPALDARTTATLRLLAAQGCRVWHLTSGRGPVPPAHLWGFAFRPLDLEPYPAPRPGRAAKRALDAVLSGAALLALAPVLAACALAVRLSDGPGVLFRQERIGLGGRPFTLLKFRTLRPADSQESATLWSVAHDSRVSRVGRLLRRTSLDELPQLWNVLRGDMSLVGPRPERPHFVEEFSRAHPGYRDRHRMPAGITGLAQVHGLRGDTSISDRARFDNHYIDSWSWWQDIAILLRTVGSLFRMGGS